MYWNNPIIEASVVVGPDLIARSLHQGQHCLFYDPAVPITDIIKLRSLKDICDLANQYIGCFYQITEPGHINDVANIVRINQFVHSLRKQGNLKPVLLNYTGNRPMAASTGGSRAMAAERIPELKSFSAFISTHNQYRSEFSHLEEITTLEQFAQLCGADEYTRFCFRLTDANADYGLDWYEVSLETTSVPDDSQCMYWLKNYLGQQADDFVFAPEWFDQEINWTTFGHH